VTKFSDADAEFMAVALTSADKAKGTTFPNPSVGAVIVKNGHIIGKGATSEYGGPHAEINALEMAGIKARGATLYVTLEPCCHHGRTGPCTDSIIRSGISRVFVSTKDPNPLVNGKGIRILREKGIEVSVGLREKEAVRINEDFFFWIRRKRPWVTVKLAMTLDGRIADTHGDSKWITSEAARKRAHDVRRQHAAVAVGATTLVRDNPRLTVRHGFHGSPVRFVFSSKEIVPAASYFAASGEGPGSYTGKGRSILVVAGGKRSKTRSGSGVEIWHTGVRDEKGSLRAFLAMAGQEGLCSILVEGGRKLASGFLECRLVNRLILFYGNKIIGNGIPGIEFRAPLRVSKPVVLDDMEMSGFGTDVMVSGVPHWS
jgi:diaminohydroxyphosphoribosylaminopyrimidine deaminase/5-amino-6-(5-phosphoribosylamino)uracil reductase